MYRADTFFDIFTLDMQLGTLDYGDEAKYWVAKDREDRLRNKLKITPQVIYQSATKIQRYAQRYLAQRKALIYMENVRRRQMSRNPGLTRAIILKRAAIQVDIKRAYLQTFTLLTELNDKKKVQMSIQIHVKTLEHLYSLEFVQAYIQKLFYVVESSELMSIAAYMVENCKVIKGKQNILKVDSQPLEKVQGILINMQRERGGVEIKDKKDETIDFRVRLNQGQFRRQRFENISALEYTTGPAPEHIFNSEVYQYRQKAKEQYCIKVLQQFVKLVKRKLHQRVRDSKTHIKDDDESSQVKNLLPTSKYAFPVKNNKIPHHSLNEKQ